MEKLQNGRALAARGAQGRDGTGKAAEWESVSPAEGADKLAMVTM
jgi:hypothetical protein